MFGLPLAVQNTAFNSLPCREVSPSRVIAKRTPGMEGNLF